MLEPLPRLSLPMKTANQDKSAMAESRGACSTSPFLLMTDKPNCESGLFLAATLPLPAALFPSIKHRNHGRKKQIQLVVRGTLFRLQTVANPPPQDNRSRNCWGVMARLGCAKLENKSSTGEERSRDGQVENTITTVFAHGWQELNHYRPPLVGSDTRWNTPGSKLLQ